MRSTAEYLERFVFENIRRPVPVFGLAAFTPPPELYAASQLRNLLLGLSSLLGSRELIDDLLEHQNRIIGVKGKTTGV